MKKKKNLKRATMVPDYDHVFNETDTPKDKKRNSVFLKKILKINTKPLVWSSILYIVQSLPLWLVPLLTANIINIVTRALIEGGEIHSELWISLGVNVALIFVSILQNIPTTICRAKITSKMFRRTSAGIKSSVVKKLQSLSITYHKDMQTGKIQSKFLKDTDTIDNFLSTVTSSVIPNIISALIAVVVSVVKNGIVALFFLVVIPINIAMSMGFRKKIRKNSRDYRIRAEDMSMKLSNMLTMMPVTKSHGLEQTEISSINKSIKRLAGSGMTVDKTNAKFGAMMFVCNHLMSIICFVFCIVLALYGYIPVGDVVLYQSMFNQINSYVTSIINMMPGLASGVEAFSSVAEIMTSNDVEVSIGKIVPDEIRGEVEFKKACYKYPHTKRYVIKDFSLKVKEGECIAFVGASGSGKSTIMNMIIGFLLPNKGDVLIDGKSIKNLNLSCYRHQISVVSQNSILLAGTIRENITYGLHKYTDEELERVVEMANLKEFTDSLPLGLDTPVGERGDKLSGGQRQRITIARALIRNPKIFILDEATSALDNISEYHVQKAISSSIKGRTTFIVAHRLSTIRDADRIVVMENGCAVEIGTYSELMQKKASFINLNVLTKWIYKWLKPHSLKMQMPIKNGSRVVFIVDIEE